jgi:RNA polymerase sigma-70 factor (ECF subfamily)
MNTELETEDIVAIKDKNFDFIFKKYRPMIMRKMLFYCNGDAELAEDLTSDTFVKVIENIDKYSENGGKFKSWVYKLIHTTFVDNFRQLDKKLTLKAVSIDSLFKSDVGEEGESKAKVQVADDNLLVFEEITLKESHEDLRVALSKLSETEQELIHMRYFENMRWDIIAENLGENENSCKVKVLRAKKKLKKMLSK